MSALYYLIANSFHKHNEMDIITVFLQMGKLSSKITGRRKLCWKFNLRIHKSKPVLLTSTISL